MPGTATHQIAVLGAIGRGCFSIDEIAAHLPMTHRKVAKAAGKLISRRLVERLERGQYRLTKAGADFLEEGSALVSGPRGPHTGQPRKHNTFRQRAWTAMRLMRRFSIPDIVMRAAREGDADPAANTRRWLLFLVAAGYVVELPVRADDGVPTSNGLKVFRLLRDTGPLAPAHRKGGDLYDHNLREVVPCPR